MITSIVLTVALTLGADSLLTSEIQLIEDGYQFTEGPLWLPGEEKWIFSDVQANTIYDSKGENHLKPSKNTNGLAADGQGRVVACQSQTHSIVRFERDGSTTVLASQFKGKPLNSTNDLVVRSDGVIFFTDPIPLQKGFESVQGFSGVYALWPDEGTIKLVSKTMKYPNGIGFSPDEKTLYVSDTSNTGIWAYAVDESGDASDGKKFCKIGIPDGMAVDELGNVWSSGSRGITVFNENGEQLETIKTSMMPTNCAFGGPDGKSFLITARKQVFGIDTSVRGLSVLR